MAMAAIAGKLFIGEGHLRRTTELDAWTGVADLVGFRHYLRGLIEWTPDGELIRLRIYVDTPEERRAKTRGIPPPAAPRPDRTPSRGGQGNLL